MMLADWQIKQLCRDRRSAFQDRQPMIMPFVDHKVSFSTANEDGEPIPCVSYGLESYGYSIRMSSVGLRYIGSPYELRRIDPLKADPNSFPDVPPHRIRTNEFGKFIDLHPGEAILGVSVEHFCMPNNIKGKCSGKSTYARCATDTLVTPLEPGWYGYLTIEVVNSSLAIVQIYLDNHGILSLEFESGPTPMSTYSSDGKYQGQANEVVLPRAPEVKRVYEDEF